MMEKKMVAIILSSKEGMKEIFIISMISKNMFKIGDKFQQSR